MRHKFVTNNGQIPKCITSRLKASESLPPSKISPSQRTRGALLLLTPFFYIATPTHPILQPQYSSRWVHYRGAPGQKSLERGRLYTATDLVGFLLTQIL